MNQDSILSFFAIVVTFAYEDDTPVITVNDVSVVPGDIPARTAPVKPSQVLQACQRYYVKSFPPATAPAQNAGATGAQGHYQMLATGNSESYSYIRFGQPLRATPTITRYNPSAANANSRNLSVPNDDLNTTTLTPSLTGFYISFQTTSSAIGNLHAIHWTADARLGVV